jgi:hypothetical protein
MDFNTEDGSYESDESYEILDYIEHISTDMRNLIRFVNDIFMVIANKYYITIGSLDCYMVTADNNIEEVNEEILSKQTIVNIILYSVVSYRIDNASCLNTKVLELCKNNEKNKLILEQWIEDSSIYINKYKKDLYKLEQNIMNSFKDFASIKEYVNQNIDVIIYDMFVQAFKLLN